MRVSDLAAEFGVTSEEILKKLKALRLKAKDGKQELNAVVVSVIKSEFKKEGKVSKPVAPKAKETKTSEEPKRKAKEIKAKKTTKKEKPEPKKKKEAKKKTEDKKKATVKKTTKVKKAVKTTAKEKTEKTAVKTKVKTTKKIVKAKAKVIEEPFVSLKPLAKKRKKKYTPASGTHAIPSVAPDVKKTLEDGSGGAVDEVKDKGVVAPSLEEVRSSEAEAREAERIANLEPLEIKVPITVKELSVRLQQKSSAILKRLIQLGIFANINFNLGEDIVKKLASEFGYNVTKVKTQEQQLVETHKEEEEDPKLLKPRAPVVTFMGHVDHGKTSLLDKIRKSNITDREHGGITQHMAAYSVQSSKGKITFLDTPGHEAFTSMRARGAHITDLVILVIAADEGIMPQTMEAIDHARAANVPIVVALNKIDRKNADSDKVKKQLNENGLSPEEWGGKTIVAEVSAATGEGIDHLLEMIVLESELLELKANPDKKASGIVVEAHLSRGKGAVADLIVQSGTLKEGDFIVVGSYYGRVKAMFDDHDRSIKEVGPSAPVEILGLAGVPEAGEIFYIVDDEKQAKEIASRRQEQIKNEKLGANQKITLEDLYSQIKEGMIKELNVILKADVQGSLEALKDSLAKIPSDEVKIKFIHTGVGEVNTSDVLLAVASNAIIICFHVDVEARAQSEVDKQEVEVRKYRIIYDAVNDIHDALEGLLEPKIKKKFISRVEIRQVFKLSRSGVVAGCFVKKGKVHRKVDIDIVRGDEVVFSGKISSLKRFKDDVRDVNEGMECGVTIEGFTKIEPGDIIECYELEKISRKL